MLPGVGVPGVTTDTTPLVVKTKCTDFTPSVVNTKYTDFTPTVVNTTYTNTPAGEICLLERKNINKGA